MAINKQVAASTSYVNSVAAIAAPATALSATAAVESVVFNGQLLPSDRVTRPGVFTAGTPTEGTATNYSASN